MSRICVWLLLLLLPSSLWAQRAHQTMTAYIQEAAVIAVVDTQAQGYDTQITFREILKGDPALASQTWICHLARSRESVSMPKDAKGILVLLGQDWRKPDNDAVIEAYQSPADIALLRALIAVNALPTERKRVLALRAHISDPDPRWLLTPGHSDDARQQALQILSRLQGARILPLLRRLLPQNDALRSDVLLLLSRYGTPDDLVAFLPLADFWTGDRANHYWAMDAVAEIRDRHHWDINGPIHAD